MFLMSKNDEESQGRMQDVSEEGGGETLTFWGFWAFAASGC